MLLEAKYGFVDAFMAYITLAAYRKIRRPRTGTTISATRSTSPW